MIQNQFEVNGEKFVARSAVVNGRRGNIWSVFKKCDDCWILQGTSFACQSADRDEIMSLFIVEDYLQ